MYNASCIFVLFIVYFINNIPFHTAKRNDMLKAFIEKNHTYSGEKFPVKYLVPEQSVPTKGDLANYINGLTRTINYFNEFPNKSDCNVGLGSYLSRGVLQRTLLDYGDKLDDIFRDAIKQLIQGLNFYLSHYILANQVYGWSDAEFRISLLYVDDAAPAISLGEYNKYRLIKWILSKISLNNFAETFDDLSFPKEKYAEIVENMQDYFVSIDESDTCISRIIYNRIPINLSQMQSCRQDTFCLDRLHSSPSVAYSLSHRFLNILVPRLSKRCYWKSVEDDDLHMDILCSSMYREAVYIARRGFFARDLFLEHIALCSLLGYEEFSRPRWYQKALGWMDEEGCITEFSNFDLNRTKYLVKRAGEDKKAIKRIKRTHRKSVLQDCHEHPMALLMIVLAQAIRHAVHFIYHV